MTTRPVHFFPEAPPDPASLQAKHRLALGVRGLVEDIAVADSTAGVEALHDASRKVDEARKAISTLATLTEGDISLRENLPPERGPFLGQGNAVAPPLHLDVAEDHAIGWAIYGKAYDGSVGLVHGGAVTASFADVLASAQALHAPQAHIGTITVRFRAPIPGRPARRIRSLA